MGFIKKSKLFKIAIIFMLFLTQFSLGTSANAESNETAIFEGKAIQPQLFEGELIESVPTIDFTPVETNEISPLSANGVPITAKVSDTNVEVYIGNVGTDPLDKVTVKVTATGYSEQSQSATKILPAVGKKFNFSISEISLNMVYTIIVTITDGGLTQNWADKIDKSYTESDLAEWHPGTYPTRVKSVDYHFGKHRTEVGAKTVTQYLAAASSMHVMVRGIKATTDTYTLVKTPATGGRVAQKKYTHKATGRFIIVTDTSYTQILSFGGK